MLGKSQIKIFHRTCLVFARVGSFLNEIIVINALLCGNHLADKVAIANVSTKISPRPDHNLVRNKIKD